MESSKACKGSVVVDSYRNRLRLRLPRQLFDGKQKYLTLGLDDTLKNRKLASAKARLMESDIAYERFDYSLEKYKPQENKEEVKPTSGPLLDVLWDKYSEYRKSQVAATTFKCNYQSRYPNAIAQLPTKKLDGAVAIRDYLLQTKSTSTAKQLLIQFSACCNWAVESNLISTNPFLGMAGKIRLAGEKREIDPFSVQERNVIIKAFEEHPRHSFYANFVRFLFATGCRTSEAVGLRWRHVNPDCTQITFYEAISKGVQKGTKTSKSRIFPCNASLQAFLLSMPRTQSDSLVFPNRSGKAISPASFLHKVWKGEESKGVTGIVTQLAADEEIEHYRPQYNTRHTFITLALENGLDVKDVAKLVGNSPEIIYRYYAGSNIEKLSVPEF